MMHKRAPIRIKDISRNLEGLTKPELAKLVWRLPKKQKEVFLKRWGGLRLQEIAYEGMKYNTVKANYRHAMLRLQRELNVTLTKSSRGIDKSIEVSEGECSTDNC